MATSHDCVAVPNLDRDTVTRFSRNSPVVSRAYGPKLARDSPAVTPLSCPDTSPNFR
jgi:hypothetical protein